MLSEKAVYKLTKKDMFIAGMKACIPTIFGYLSIGFAAGVIEKASGLSLLEIILLSILVYAGSAQFIAAGMFAVGAPAIAIIITVFFVNIRHLLMSAALAPYFRHVSWLHNTATGLLLTDETFGVATTYLEKRKQGDYYWMLGLNITAYLNWIIANILGALFGSWIHDPEKFGMDFALTAMFIGLFVLQIKSRKIKTDYVVALVAIVITCFVGQWSENVAVILAIIGAATVGMGIEKWKSDGKSSSSF
ncbi:AzlC family ABC transporter permease [Ectobacillus sp. JY-23]|uniref:AzlC family ABC transporter permease n=1 Tax=Ectobacillus sp. JY-23 TaxID=2933872 RepID=UPI001FF3E628|nr:AzlC family ABC transporter permease [Ectobacillus sp. JY-23]UOY92768.1 AzlC family ABC transporter permease [Ectobacillus sp. JY-23]